MPKTETATIRDLVLGFDPYEGFPLETWDLDLQGWGSDHPVFERLLKTVRPSLVIEVGTWKGRSVLRMAEIAKALGLTTEFICIDTWLGGPEHFLKRSDGYFDALRMRHGYPQLYYQFLANVLLQGHSDVVIPLAQTSDNAAVILRRLGVTADLVYIDAAHEYDPVKRDLNNYWPLVRPGGMLFGDDYARADGVTRAVHEFTRDHNLSFIGERGKFAIAKDRHLSIDLAFSEPGT